MSLLESIDDFQTGGGYIVTRSAIGAPVNGYFPAPSTSTFTIEAVATPLGGTLLVLPEGISGSDVLVFYTATPLFDARSGDKPDSIAVGANTYVVFQIDGPFIMPDSTHFRVFAARQRLP